METTERKVPGWLVERIGRAMRAAGYDTAGSNAEIFWRIVRGGAEERDGARK